MFGGQAGRGAAGRGVLGRCGLATTAAWALALAPTPAAAIEGGWDADPARYPYQVSLEYRGTHICAGGVLGATTVLVPAHCADVMAHSQLAVRPAAAEARTKPGPAPSRPGARAVAKVALHPDYDQTTGRADLAVLTLAAPLDLGPGLKAVGLPGQGTDPSPGTVGTVSGWGAAGPSAVRSPTLRAARVTVAVRGACGGAGRAVDRWLLCAVPDGAHLRRGDDGNPLMVGGTLVGLAGAPNHPSGTDRSRGGGEAAAFLGTGAYSDWIRTAAAR
ncbi:trypsin-like serine protease [Streptomyces sp. Y1]|uniref:Trypsin-like serine protease n=1 Tax=Streptomyces sp. Y1 TaxID=3238634 RepID=A0AB39TFH0_9ACTN